MNKIRKVSEELKDLPFEDALKRLEATVEEMENGNLPLDNMIKCFERGSILASVCAKKLKEVEKKIEVLVKEDANEGQWQEFDTSSSRHVPLRENEKVTQVSTDNDVDDEENELTLF